MHTEETVAAFFLNDMTLAYKEMCVYNLIRWEQYMEAGVPTNPGFIFSIILN
jgi:hypothetical protein